MVIKFNLNPQAAATVSDEPVFLGVDFYDLLDIIKVTGETSYYPGNGFWYVKTRKGEWIQLEYANREERTAIRNEIKELVIAFEKRMGKKWNSLPRVR